MAKRWLSHLDYFSCVTKCKILCLVSLFSIWFRFDPKVNRFDKSIQMSANISCSCTYFCWLWTSTERSTNEFWLKWCLNAIVSKQREREQCLAPIVYSLCKSVRSFEKVDMVSKHAWKWLVKTVTYCTFRNSKWCQ